MRMGGMDMGRVKEIEDQLGMLRKQLFQAKD